MRCGISIMVDNLSLSATPTFPSFIFYSQKDKRDLNNLELILFLFSVVFFPFACACSFILYSWCLCVALWRWEHKFFLPLLDDQNSKNLNVCLLYTSPSPRDRTRS